jgi:OmpA-OmpF porin, OOP family
MKKMIFLSVLLSFVFAYPVFAANRDGSVTIGLSGGGYTFDTREDVQATPLGMVRLGFDFTKNMGFELLYEQAQTKTRDTDSLYDLFGVRAEGLYYFMPNSWFVPYLAIGAGDRTYKIKNSPTHSNFVADYGVGARFFATESFFIRGDFRHILAFNTSKGNPVNNLEYTLGIGWCLGGKKQAPAPVAEVAPVIVEPPKPAPVVKPEPVIPPVPVAAPTEEIKVKGRTTIDVKFKTNKADISPAYDGELAEFADVLKKYPDLNVTIEGFTDSVGSAQYNKKLSQRRAESVKKYLVDKLGIDASRLKAVGYGLEKPIASNKTEEGRKKNRRVEAAVDNSKK